MERLQAFSYANEVLTVLDKGPATLGDIRHHLNKGKWFWQQWSKFEVIDLLQELQTANIIILYMYYNDPKKILRCRKK